MALIKKFEDFHPAHKAQEDCEHDIELNVNIDQEEEDDLLLDDDEELDEAADPRAVTSKDTMRINDIKSKAQGNNSKAMDLARRMAKAITDKFKALRRAKAAEDMNFHDLADIFYQRASELGAFEG